MWRRNIGVEKSIAMAATKKRETIVGNAQHIYTYISDTLTIPRQDEYTIG